MKVTIHHGGVEGSVEYNPSNHEVMVAHPNKDVRKVVRDYLHSEQEFDFDHSSGREEGQVMTGNRVLLTKKPTDDEQTMHMALCQLHYNTGVHVNWGKDPNEEADKPIVKSIDGEDYELIN